MDVLDFDDKQTEKLIEQFSRLGFSANLKKSIVQDLLKNRKESVIYKKYPISKVVSMLENPDRNEFALREMSNFLYMTSTHYRRLINYYAKLPTFNYIITPSHALIKKPNKTKYRESYYMSINDFEKYNLKNEIPKIFITVLLEGVFYGLYYETNESFYIKPFNGRYAKISSVEDGCFVYSIDLSYFTGREFLLKAYGIQIENAYYHFKGNKEKNIIGDSNKRWYEPKNGICIKSDENDPLISAPYFCGLFKEILDLEDYRLLAKAKTEMDNYKVLSLKMDVDDDGVPKMEYELAKKYYNQAASNIPDGIGLILSPFDIDDFSFQSANVSDTDQVQDAEDNLWSSAGTSPLIFGSTKATSSASLLLSVKPDEQISFNLLNQVARNLNRIQKKRNYEYTFQIKFLDQSIFNADEYANRVFKGGQYGVSGAKTLYAASIGLSPSDVLSLSYLEDDILGFTNKIFNKPFLSSNTMSPDSSSNSDTGGAPTQEEKGQIVTDNTEASRENNGNNENK